MTAAWRLGLLAVCCLLWAGVPAGKAQSSSHPAVAPVATHAASACGASASVESSPSALVFRLGGRKDLDYSTGCCLDGYSTCPGACGPHM